MQSLPAIDRRQFVNSLAGLAVSSVALKSLTAQEKAKLTADQFISGKDARLIVHSAKVGEIETPLELLRKHAITPKELLFIRNNQALKNTFSLEPAKDADWSIEIVGGDEQKSVTAGQLAKMPQQEVELVLQCSGNGRSRYNQSAQVDGVPWGNGAMGNVVFGGVSLKQVFDRLGIKPKPDVRYVTAEGKDTPTMPGGDDFEHSIPLADALERTMIALTLNGEPIPQAHGGPVRLITPGYYGTMNLKWLGKLRLESEESKNRHHAVRYRTPLKPIEPGSKFDATLENSEPNWDMKIKSVIFGPLASDKVSTGKTEIYGVAFNDGQMRIDAVEVSTDAGQTWHKAKVTRPKSPYAWHPWKISLDLASGERTILSRAIDAKGQTQPLDGSIDWNPAGYIWNGVDAVTINVT